MLLQRLTAVIICRFSELFTEDESGIPRTWGPKVSIPAVTQKSRLGAAHVLALLACNRLHAEEVSLASPALQGAAGRVQAGAGLDHGLSNAALRLGAPQRCSRRCCNSLSRARPAAHALLCSP